MGSKGYKYFGAARELPGVRELFENAEPAAPRKSRAELMRDIDAAYYGFRDDEDGLLVPLEVVAETAAIQASLKKWKKKKLNEDKESELDEDITSVPQMSENDRLEEAMEAGKEARFVSYINIPSQDDIKQALLRRKKQELLMQYDLEDDDPIDNKADIKETKSDINKDEK